MTKQSLSCFYDNYIICFVIRIPVVGFKVDAIEYDIL